jgi:hypothetical protein
LAPVAPVEPVAPLVPVAPFAPVEPFAPPSATGVHEAFIDPGVGG